MNIKHPKENQMARNKRTDPTLETIFSPELCDKNGPIPAHNHDLGNCWLWKGSVFPNSGRPRVLVPRLGGWELVARHVLELMGGNLGVGEQACHRCHNRECIRPDHLERGSQKHNLAMSVRDGRMSPGNADLQRVVTEAEALAWIYLYLSVPTTFAQMGRVAGVHKQTVLEYTLHNRGKLPESIWPGEALQRLAQQRKHSRPRNTAGQYTRKQAA
jgi:hypothetical protein